MEEFKINIIGHDRGNFKTLFEKSKFNLDIKQVSMSKTFPGVIKAFHKHNKQTDVWYVVDGNVRAVTTDGEERKVYILGEDYEQKVLVIPPGLWHGYQVLGNKPATMLYLLTEEYDPSDEIRADYNKFFDWKVMNK
jgi:dTDP-4-dehydrorhamnose 3,5-epimerase